MHRVELGVANATSATGQYTGTSAHVDLVVLVGRYEFGTDCEIAGTPECSMWRDHLVFNEVGIPALTYGPTSMVGAGRFTMPRADLVRAARVYALTALALCGKP